MAHQTETRPPHPLVLQQSRRTGCPPSPVRPTLTTLRWPLLRLYILLREPSRVESGEKYQGFCLRPHCGLRRRHANPEKAKEPNLEKTPKRAVRISFAPFHQRNRRPRRRARRRLPADAAAAAASRWSSPAASREPAPVPPRRHSGAGGRLGEIAAPPLVLSAPTAPAGGAIEVSDSSRLHGS